MMDNIKDRGNKKWQGLILTEHAALIREWEEECLRDERPKLDEWELTLIADEIERAHKNKATIKLTYWREGYLKDDYGNVIDIDKLSQTIVLDDPFSTTRYSFSEIVAVSLITDAK